MSKPIEPFKNETELLGLYVQQKHLKDYREWLQQVAVMSEQVKAKSLDEILPTRLTAEQITQIKDFLKHDWLLPGDVGEIYEAIRHVLTEGS